MRQFAIGDPIGAELTSVEVLDRGGEPSRLGEFWREGPALLVFLRHFGCVGCAEHVTELSPHLLEIQRLGARAVFVGNGSPDFIAGFEQRHLLGDKKVEIVTDPTLAAFRAAGLERSAASTTGPLALLNYARARFKGFQNRIEGDRTQQGGVLLVDRKGRVAYYHRDRRLGDHPPVVDVVAAVLRVAASGQKLP